MGTDKSGLDEEKEEIETIYDYGDWKPSPALAAKIAKLKINKRNNLHRVAVARLGKRGSFTWLFSSDNPNRLCTYANYDAHWLNGKDHWREVLEQYIEELSPVHFKNVERDVNRTAKANVVRAIERLTEIVESDNEQVARLAAMDVLKVGGAQGASDSTTVNVNVKKLSDDELRDIIAGAIGANGVGGAGGEAAEVDAASGQPSGSSI